MNASQIRPPTAIEMNLFGAGCPIAQEGKEGFSRRNTSSPAPFAFTMTRSTREIEAEHVSLIDFWVTCFTIHNVSHRTLNKDRIKKI